MNTPRMYRILSAAVVVAILLLGWFGAISPQLQQIALAQEQVTSANAQNDVLTQTLANLKTESDRLPELTDDLDALRLQIPETAQIDIFVRELQSLAAANGVDLTSLTVPDAILYPAPVAAAAPTTDPSAEAAPEPAPTDLTTPTTSTTTTAPSTDVQPSAALAPNLYTINFSMSVSGPGDGIVAFLRAVQTGGRISLVTSVSLNTQAPDALGTATISGYIFIVSTPATRAAATAATPAPAPTATPTPTPTVAPAPTPDPTETPAG